MAVIGISGSYGGLNVGDEAILTAMVTVLRDARQDHELVVFSRDADQTRGNHNVDRPVATRDVSRDQVIPEIERLDLFLLGGGGLLYDGEARAYLRDVGLAQDRGIPTFAYAVGAGPLHDPVDRKLVRSSSPTMTGVTTRDEASKRLLEEVGVNRDITVTADPALPAPTGRPGCVRQKGSAMRMRSLAPCAQRTGHACCGDATVRARYWGLMEHLDLVIGMRLHLLVFAAIAGVPFLPLPYADKVVEFAASVGVPVPAAVERESAGPLLAAIDHAWDHRAEERTRLPERVAKLQEQARRTADLALSLLDDSSPNGGRS
jgi:polysaccharide pyruvyl transferase WcaK-like protein